MNRRMARLAFVPSTAASRALRRGGGKAHDGVHTRPPRSARLIAGARAQPFDEDLDFFGDSDAPQDSPDVRERDRAQTSPGSRRQPPQQRRQRRQNVDEDFDFFDDISDPTARSSSASTPAQRQRSRAPLKQDFDFFDDIGAAEDPPSVRTRESFSRGTTQRRQQERRQHPVDEEDSDFFLGFDETDDGRRASSGGHAQREAQQQSQTRGRRSLESRRQSVPQGRSSVDGGGAFGEDEGGDGGGLPRRRADRIGAPSLPTSSPAATPRATVVDSRGREIVRFRERFERPKSVNPDLEIIERIEAELESSVEPDTLRCIVEVRDPRVPASSRCRLFDEWRARYDAAYMVVYPRAEIVPEADKLNLRMFTAAQMDIPPENVFFEDLRNIRRLRTPDRGEMVSKIRRLALQRGAARRGSSIAVLVAGVPNSGKSSVVYISTRTLTKNRKRRGLHHLPSVTHIAGNLREVRRNWLNLRPDVVLYDLPGVISECHSGLGDEPEAVYRLAAVQCMSLPRMEVESDFHAVDVADYMLYRLNRARKFEYTRRYGLLLPTDDVKELLRHVPGATTKASALFFLRDFQRNKLGFLILDAVPELGAQEMDAARAVAAAAAKDVDEDLVAAKQALPANRYRNQLLKSMAADVPRRPDEDDTAQFLDEVERKFQEAKRQARYEMRRQRDTDMWNDDPPSDADVDVL